MADTKTRIRMLTRATHPEIGVLHPGSVYTIETSQAEDFLNGGYAERVAADAAPAAPAPSSPLKDHGGARDNPDAGKPSNNAPPEGKKKGRA